MRFILQMSFYMAIGFAVTMGNPYVVHGVLFFAVAASLAMIAACVALFVITHNPPDSLREKVTLAVDLGKSIYQPKARLIDVTSDLIATVFLAMLNVPIAVLYFAHIVAGQITIDRLIHIGRGDW